jgi:hypothetical protein
MAHEFLKRAGINAAAGQGITSSVAQHVSVDREWQFSSPTSTLLEQIGSPHCMGTSGGSV